VAAQRRAAAVASRLLLIASAVAAVAAPAAGCAPSGSTPPSQGPSTSPSVGAGSPPASMGGSQAAVAADPELLRVLPGTIDGLALDYDPAATTETTADPELAATTEAIAYAIAAAPDGQDFAIPVVTRPRPGVFGDEFFRRWRDSFDESVCAQAGGVSGHTQTELGGRTVYIGTCQGGVVIYHTHLGTSGLLVSVSSVGERRLGEKLMGALRDG
jgi:hypothetical protein